MINDKTCMETTRKIALIVLLAAGSAPAQENPVHQLFRSMVAQSAGAVLPTTEELFTKVNETTVGALSVAEVKAVLPLAQQCIQSTHTGVRQDGMVLFLSVVTRPDSAKLLEPYIDDLGTLLEGTEGAQSMRHAALYVLGSMKPNLPLKAIAHLNAHLEKNRNSDEETLTIAASLVEASPTDASTLHKVLLVLSSRSDPGLTNGVLRQMGLSKSRLPEALTFIAANLSQTDSHLRASAVDAVARLDSDERVQFSTQLARIANDPTESEHVRKQAQSALQR
jgi:hypothetical protein